MLQEGTASAQGVKREHEADDKGKKKGKGMDGSAVVVDLTED